MDLSQLRYSFTSRRRRVFLVRRRRCCGRSPRSALRSKRLEEELGETLFDRSSKAGTLTEAGRILPFLRSAHDQSRDEALSAVSE
jgi:DNA-binding transcriptional LysR family regulator